jgi:hypothetical protein
MREKIMDENLIVGYWHSPTLSEMEGLAIMLIGVVHPNERVKAYFTPLMVIGAGRVLHLIDDETDRATVINHVAAIVKGQEQILVSVNIFIDQSYDWWLQNREKFMRG